MGKGEETHPRRRSRPLWLRILPEILVLVVVALSFVEVRYDVADRWLGIGPADPVADPAQVQPPQGLDLAEETVAAPVAAPRAAGRVDARAVAAALAPYLKDDSLGPSFDVAVADVRTGQVVLRRGTGTVTPASTLKVMTAAAALDVLGPTTRFTTSVRQRGRTVVLVGGGDPFLMPTTRSARGTYPRRASLEQLAQRTAVSLREQGIARVRLAYDDSLFTGPAVNPAWPETYVPEGVVPPITALWSDQGRGSGVPFVADPSAAAADVFRAELGKQGIVATGRILERPDSTALPEIASVRSAPVGEIVQRMLEVSDNQAAEVLARQVGLKYLGDGSFDGASRAMLKVLRNRGVTTTNAQVYDGSGLARVNKVSPRTLIDVLRLAASPESRRLRQVITGLPVAGFTGSLERRFDESPQDTMGMVRAKTGTLTGVHGLAGVVVDRSGTELAFVAIADRVPEDRQLEARLHIDDLAAALAACTCGG